jgi:isopentenyl-diphosphate delta-isomerase
MSAARRRLNEELGVCDRLSFGFSTRYRADFGNGLSENEFVYVYFGPLGAPPQPNPAEIAQLEFASVTEVARRIRRQPDGFAFWLRHYFRDHLSEITRSVDMAKQGFRT